MRNLRVMIVDDEPTARAALSSLIARIGRAELVGEAEDGRQALVLMEEKRPDVMLVDIVMPGMDGLTLVSRARETDPGVQIIMLTMHRDFTYAVQALRLGALDYLNKDAYDGQQLAKALDKARQQLEKDSGQASIEAEKALETPAQERLWAGRAGRLACFQENDKPRFPRTEQLSRLESLELFSGIYPLDVDRWVALGDADDDALTRALSGATGPEKAYSLIFTRVIQGLTARKLQDAAPWMNERFYFPGVRIVSGEAYAGDFSRAQLSEMRRGFLSFMQGERDAFPGDLAAECLDGHISPESLKGLLASCAEDWGGGAKWARATANDIRRARTLKEAEVLTRAFALREKLSPEREERREIQRVKQYIRENPGADLSLPALARRVGLSPSYLSATFKAQTGDGLKRFVTQTRLETAAELLANGNQFVYQIAEGCGFANVRYFSGAFLTAYGMTPQDYRKKARNG